MAKNNVAKYFFDNYHTWKKEIESFNDILEHFEGMKSSGFISSIDYSKSPVQSSGHVSNNEDMIINLDAKTSLVKIKIQDLESKIQLIHLMLDTLNDEERTYLYDRYIERKSIERISRENHVSSATIYRRIDKSFNVLYQDFKELLY